MKTEQEQFNMVYWQLKYIYAYILLLTCSVWCWINSKVETAQRRTDLKFDETANSDSRQNSVAEMFSDERITGTHRQQNLCFPLVQSVICVILANLPQQKRQNTKPYILQTAPECVLFVYAVHLQPVRCFNNMFQASSRCRAAFHETKLKFGNFHSKVHSKSAFLACRE